jgi:hypothetical protein
MDDRSRALASSTKHYLRREKVSAGDGSHAESGFCSFRDSLPTPAKALTRNMADERRWPTTRLILDGVFSN